MGGVQGLLPEQLGTSGGSLGTLQGSQASAPRWGNRQHPPGGFLSVTMARSKVTSKPANPYWDATALRPCDGWRQHCP